MNILLVNDDGFDSPFLQLLCRATAARGHHVTVCAPAAQQSAKSHAYTVFQPLLAKRREMEGAAQAWAIEGTPVDCCRIGFMSICEKRPDLVISGINHGYNTGFAVFVSGTVGAAREAAFQGIPAMALSAEYETPPETLAFFADWAVSVGERLVDYPAPAFSVCNLNVPPVPMYELKEPKMCGITHNLYKDSYERRKSPRGEDYFWLTPLEQDYTYTPDSDQEWLSRGHITCTFLTPDEGVEQEKYADFLTEL